MKPSISLLSSMATSPIKSGDFSMVTFQKSNSKKFGRSVDHSSLVLLEPPWISVSLSCLKYGSHSSSLWWVRLRDGWLWSLSQPHVVSSHSKREPSWDSLGLPRPLSKQLLVVWYWIELYNYNFLCILSMESSVWQPQSYPSWSQLQWVPSWWALLDPNG